MTNEQFAKLVDHLEAIAERRPSLYKLRVMLLACVGYVYIFLIVTLVVGTVVLIGLGVVISDEFAIIAAKIGIKLGLPLLVLLAIMARALWVRLEAPEGVRVTRKDAPELFKLLRTIRKRLKAPRTDVVLLNPDFNAGIVQIPRLGLLGWQKNYLVLGLPLMQALSQEQFTAVLGHEYGHLSGAHSKLGGWIYRIRMTWFQLMEALDRQEHWGAFIFRKFFDWYAPYFSAYSFVLARSNEYEADRCASELTGVHVAAQALVGSALYGAFLSDDFWPGIYQTANTTSKPPKGVYAAMSRKLHEPLPDTKRKWLAMALNTQTGLDDTHPCLRDRLAALGAEPELPPRVAETAAEHFLGDALERIESTFDDAWTRGVEESWEERYRHVQKSRSKIEEAKAKYDAGTLNVQKTWEYGQLLQDIEGEESALPVYRAIYEREPTHSPAMFLAGQIMLNRGNEEGIELVDKAMRQDFELIVPGNRIVFEYLCEHGREQEARRRYDAAQERIELIAKAREERSWIPFDSTYQRAALTSEERALLVSQLKSFPNVAHAYVAQRNVQYLSEYPFYVVGVVLNPPVASERTEQDLYNGVRFPQSAAFVALTRSGKPMLEILEHVPDSKLF